MRRSFPRPGVSGPSALLLLALSLLGSSRATERPAPALAGGGAAHPASLFLAVQGFADDVDIVAAPDGQFLVVPEESADGTSARIQIVDLDPTTGQPLAPMASADVLGFENGVDAFVVPQVGGAYVVAVPTESEDGSAAEVVLLVVDAFGGLIEDRRYPLGDLGFREDVDGLWFDYGHHALYFVLESEDRSVRGVLVIDVDPTDGDVGDCTLLSTDGRALCDGFEAIDWLPGLADGADPVGYTLADRARLVVPVESDAGSDLLLVDFDPTANPPLFMPGAGGDAISVKALNAGAPHPTPFPGYERDVDLFVMEGCGLGTRAIFVPVEGREGADLYRLDENGNALWTLSEQASTLGLEILGYEIGVDVVPWCGVPVAAHPDRLVVPLESASGMEADAWLVDAATGAIFARAEDPTLNPGLVVPGFEMGIDPLLWTEEALLLAVERLDGVGGLLSMNPDGTMAAGAQFTAWGFEKSVDPVVDTTVDPPVLFVPVAEPDGSDEDVLILRTPPALASTSLETQNPGEVVSGYERDVDLGFVTRTVDGPQWIYLPEEDATGANTRLRFEPVPQPGRYLVFATVPEAPLPASLYFVRVSTGLVDVRFDDVLGLESGLDLASQAGPLTPGNPPVFVQAGYDWDTDPTLGWAGGATDTELAGLGPRPRIEHANPFRAPWHVGVAIPENGPVRVAIVDVAGRVVRELLRGEVQSGRYVVSWDGRDHRGREVAAGLYLVQLRSPTGMSSSKLVVVR